MLFLVVNEPGGGSFAVPVKELTPPHDIVEFVHHNKVFKYALPAEAEIVVECDYDSDELRRMLEWREEVFAGLVADYKRTGSVSFFSEEEEPLAERPLYGLWPSAVEPNPATMRVEFMLRCDLIGKAMSDNPITFADGVSDGQKAEIEQALTPQGIATLAKYGVQLAGDQ